MLVFFPFLFRRHPDPTYDVVPTLPCACHLFRGVTHLPHHRSTGHRQQSIRIFFHLAPPLPPNPPKVYLTPPPPLHFTPQLPLTDDLSGDFYLYRTGGSTIHIKHMNRRCIPGILPQHSPPPPPPTFWKYMQTGQDLRSFYFRIDTLR